MLANRLQELREQKRFSQGDIEKRTGLLRCYISRVENGHTVPSVETLEKWARALEVPLHALFHDDSIKPVPLKLSGGNGNKEYRTSSKDEAYFRKLGTFIAKMAEADRKLFLQMAALFNKRNERQDKHKRR